MNIRYRLMLIMVGLSSLGVCVVSWLADVHGEANLRDSAIRQLTSLRRSRAFQIESYFRILRNHVDSLSDDRMFVEAMEAFAGACDKLDPLPALRERVGRSSQIVGVGATYARVNAKYDPPFRQLINQFGYYDLLLVEPKDRRIVYSVAKNSDFGTSLSTGPYRETPLAAIVAQAMATADPDAVFVADYSPYPPPNGAPAAFVASPIFDGSSRKGVFVMQISTAEIDRVVSGERSWEKDGLGQTGDIEIVGPNRWMRSTSRALIEHPQEFLNQLQQQGATREEIRRVRAFGSTIFAMKVSLSSVAQALAGQQGTLIERGLDGRQNIVSFMPLKLPGLNWAVLAHIDLDEALAPVYKFRRNAIFWSLMAVLLTAVAAWLVSQQLLRPINGLLRAAKRMASGDLTARVRVHSQDELGLLSAAFNSMSDSIQRNMAIIEEKNRENENLLLNILPGPVAERLKNGETAIADSYPQATVLFADIVGFTSMSADREPTDVLLFLNGLFTQFDAAAKRHGIEKIKTIGDAYMAVSGILSDSANHVQSMVEMALDMLEAVRNYGLPSKIPLAIRIGVNTGSVVAGVVGSTKFIYDLWGDTVNMASRMESTGIPGRIQVTRSVYEQLKHEYDFEPRGLIEIKGKGLIETWLLRRRSLVVASDDETVLGSVEAFP